MKIEFIPLISERNLLPPIPAIRKLPDWYKKKSPFYQDGDKQVNYSGDHKNVSVKWCNPFGDALGAGYFIVLENDIQIRTVAGDISMVWARGGEDFISTHKKEQIDPSIVPEGFSDQPYKFKSFYGIKTPPGYSVLITHPLNQPELPFHTLAGIVDTDDYHLAINFPFLLRNDWEGFIDAGTPIAQVIPFKRQSWTHEVKAFDQDQTTTYEDTYRRHLRRPYKRFFWKRKEWK